jgi:hypothetical protein
MVCETKKSPAPPSPVREILEEEEGKYGKREPKLPTAVIHEDEKEGTMRRDDPRSSGEASWG